ncbi:MAG: LacI family DNA-binding transcriptional regulator [Ferruginibacter sp.]|nr:LacI family DNA-binding transcriptional regulator [Rhodoferax sp.]
MNNGNPRQRSTGRVTLADVAAAAGVSAMTASRALSGKRAVDPVLVEQVMAESGSVKHGAGRHHVGTDRGAEPGAGCHLRL